VKIYNHGLTHNEILSAAGYGTLYIPVTSPANMSDDEPALEKIVNFTDYALLMQSWLLEGLWP